MKRRIEIDAETLPDLPRIMFASVDVLENFCGPVPMILRVAMTRTAGSFRLARKDGLSAAPKGIARFARSNGRPLKAEPGESTDAPTEY